MSLTLKDILEATQIESALRESQYPLPMVQRKVEKMGATRGFLRALRQKNFSVIAEIKKKSPSMGVIAQSVINEAHEIYSAHPLVSAISVLTQSRYFGGSIDDLEAVRKFTQKRPKPILRKDFIFSEYEIYFSRWIGADAILLMANVVEDKLQFKKFHDLATSIGLDVLCEVHDAAEIEILPETVKVCGINSRRFKDTTQRKPKLLEMKELLVGKRGENRDTQTDLNTFALFDKLQGRLPPDCLKIAESGISVTTIGDVLRKHSFNAALIGTSLLKSGSQMPKMLDRMQQEASLALDPTLGSNSETSVAI